MDIDDQLSLRYTSITSLSGWTLHPVNLDGFWLVLMSSIKMLQKWSQQYCLPQSLFSLLWCGPCLSKGSLFEGYIYGRPNSSRCGRLQPTTFTSPSNETLPPFFFFPAYYFRALPFLLHQCLLFWGPIQRTHINSIHSTVSLFQLQQWRGELIFGWGEQIGGWQSSTAIRAAEEAKCVCGCRSTQMTVPGGQQFPSAGASARWSLVHWVWLIWHISDVRWTAHLNTVIPGD